MGSKSVCLLEQGGGIRFSKAECAFSHISYASTGTSHKKLLLTFIDYSPLDAPFPWTSSETNQLLILINKVVMHEGDNLYVVIVNNVQLIIIVF